MSPVVAVDWAVRFARPVYTVWAQPYESLLRLRPMRIVARGRRKRHRMRTRREQAARLGARLLATDVAAPMAAATAVFQALRMPTAPHDGANAMTWGAG